MIMQNMNSYADENVAIDNRQKYGSSKKP
jgi:hypothetical protein